MIYNPNPALLHQRAMQLNSHIVIVVASLEGVLTTWALTGVLQADHGEPEPGERVRRTRAKYQRYSQNQTKRPWSQN